MRDPGGVKEGTVTGKVLLTLSMSLTSSSYYLSFLAPVPIHPSALLPSKLHPAEPCPVLCVLRDRYVDASAELQRLSPVFAVASPH